MNIEHATHRQRPAQRRRRSIPGRGGDRLSQRPSRSSSSVIGTAVLLPILGLGSVS